MTWTAAAPLFFLLIGLYLGYGIGFHRAKRQATTNPWVPLAEKRMRVIAQAIAIRATIADYPGVLQIGPMKALCDAVDELAAAARGDLAPDPAPASPGGVKQSCTPGFTPDEIKQWCEDHGVEILPADQGENQQ